MKSNYTSTLTRCGVIIRGNVHTSAAYVRKHVHSFFLLYTSCVKLIYINKFITNKLYFSMNTEAVLHVSAIIYSHLEGQIIAETCRRGSLYSWTTSGLK